MFYTLRAMLTLGLCVLHSESHVKVRVMCVLHSESHVKVRVM